MKISISVCLMTITLVLLIAISGYSLHQQVKIKQALQQATPSATPQTGEQVVVNVQLDKDVSPKVCDNMVPLFVNPKFYDQKKVKISGYFIYDKDAPRIYLAKELAENTMYAYSFLIVNSSDEFGAMGDSVPKEKFASYHEKYVRIEGLFHLDWLDTTKGCQGAISLEWIY